MFDGRCDGMLPPRSRRVVCKAAFRDAYADKKWTARFASARMRGSLEVPGWTFAETWFQRRNDAEQESAA